MITVLVVDDHAIVRQGLVQLLSSVEDVTVLGTAAHGAEAVDLVASMAPQVVLMDLSMPVLDGVGATRQIVAASPATRVVVLTSFADERRIVDALDAGACGYILKDATPDEVIGAVRSAAAGDVPLDPKAARVLLDRRRSGPPARRLSEREQEVLLLVAEGLANKQIARRLSITERTVKAHLTNIFQHLGVTDRTQAALWARDHLH